MNAVAAMIVRRFTKVAAGPKELRGTGLESLAVAQVEPPYAELARAGRRFMGGTQIIADGIAPVAAIPTTTATLLLYNGESPGGLSYAVDRFAFFLGSGTAAAGATLLATISPQKIASAPTANAAGYSSSSCSGSTRGTKALWTTAATIAANAAWVPILSNLQLAAANVGQGDMWVDLQGALVIPPGYGLGLAILSGAGTAPLYGVGGMWSELELDLE